MILFSQTTPRETINFNGTLIKKMRLKQLELDRQEFITSLQEEFECLRQHVQRVHIQYQQTSLLKEVLTPLEEATCQMDFSENYCCTFQDEPSQVFYD